MRVLFATYPEKTIFQPMVPLAWALRAAGHEVRFASQQSFAGEITDAGLTAVPIGRHRTNTWRRLLEMDPESTETEREGLPAPYDAAVLDPENLSWETMRDSYRSMVSEGHKLNNFPLIAGLVEFALAWQPDLVIWEATTYAGAIAAEACGAAHARMLWSIDVFGVTRERYLRLMGENQDDPLGDWLAGYARKYGFDYSEDLVTGQYTIDPLPESLRMDAGLSCLPLRYVPYGGRAVVPAWLQAPPERPRIALTLGTSATEIFAGYAVSVQDLLAALSDVDVEVVATVAEAEQHKLTTVPDNARIVSYVPLHALVPTCSAVINHAGPGTFLTTALHGVPQLTLPWDFDEPELARRAAEQGATLTIHASQVTGDTVRDHVCRLLDEPTFRRQAARLRDEMFAMPTPGELVAQLEQLTATQPVR
jgi:glycosyltransferase (activator-dependent family)